MNEIMYDPHDRGERRGFALGASRGRLFKGGGGEVTQTSKTEVSPQLQPYLAPFMQQASSVAMRPYETYDGQRIADFTQDQNAGFDLARQTAQQSGQAIGNSANMLNQTLNGQNLGYSPGQNPYLGATTDQLQNQYMGAKTSVGKNAMLGKNNPYLQSAINNAQGDISRQYGDSVFNNTDATMARAGAFGGSSWQQAQSENARQMTNELGRVSNDMRMQDYNLQAQLQESDVNRRLQAQMSDIARNAGLSESEIARNMASQQQDLGRNSQLSQYGLDMQNQNWNAERARQMQASQLIPTLTQGGYQNAQALLGIGDSIQGQNQGGLDLAYQDWLGGQNHPYQQLDVMGNAIRTMMGGGGTTSQTGPNPNQRNGTASALGGALGGAAMGSAIPGVGTLIGGGLGLLGGLL